MPISERTPRVRARAMSGTNMDEKTAGCSPSRAGVASGVSATSLSISGVPVRSTRKIGCRLSDPGRKRRHSSSTSSGSAESADAVAARLTDPSAVPRSIRHRSASWGTSSRASRPSAASSSKETERTAPASARSSSRRFSRRASSRSRALSTATLTGPATATSRSRSSGQNRAWTSWVSICRMPTGIRSWFQSGTHINVRIRATWALRLAQKRLSDRTSRLRTALPSPRT